MGPGSVYWFTGLSGSGKTTLGKLFCQSLRAERRSAVFLDGDALREVFGDGLGYSAEDRRNNAMRYSRLCKFLSDQGFDVVCSTISLFHECHRWNRRNLAAYQEILVTAPLSVLKVRDRKGLYSSPDKPRDVVGIDIEPEMPKSPDVVIENDGTITPQELVEQLRVRFFSATPAPHRAKAQAK